MAKPVVKIEGVNYGLESGDPKSQGLTQAELGDWGGIILLSEEGSRNLNGL